ncbi:MAG: hypothetical protein JKP98_15130 [Rhodobacteraceae bacterium]|nr:hypothetical protein [Paracoccaceae bacterium]
MSMPRLSDLRPVLAALALAVATAAAAEPIVPAIGPSGEAYRQAIAWRGVDAAIVYADPAEPLTLLPSGRQRQSRRAGSRSAFPTRWCGSSSSSPSRSSWCS